MVRRVALAYLGGSVGGLVSALALWVAGRAELTALLGVAIAPALGWSWISRRILWGGIWGLAYPAVLRMRYRPMPSALLLSLGPSLAELLYFLPRRGHSLLGVSLGLLTPLVVLATNAIWGWTLARVVAAGGEKGASR